MDMKPTRACTRRRFLQGATALGLLAGFDRLVPAYARQSAGSGTPGSARTGPGVFDLLIHKETIQIGGREATATTINGSVPGPILRFHEGETVTVHVINEMEETTSIHWHGLLVPYDMDGVPGVSFSGIRPGETFTYRYPVRQSGTYWYHSHSGFQEQTGIYGPLIIDPAVPDPFDYDRDYVVMLSDWTYEDPDRVLVKLKKQGNYYNFNQQTISDFFRDTLHNGWASTVSDRLMWGRMRMDPADILDVTGYMYTYLVNGLSPDLNWTALFKAGERVRLRFINAASMTIFDVRIPGLTITVVQADGQNVQPVTVDEFRMGPAETYDVIVQPNEDQAYTIFAETMDRSGYASGTLAPREGMRGPIPPRRQRPLRTMADMGMSSGMDSEKRQDMSGMNTPSGDVDKTKAESMPGMKMPSGSMDELKAHNMPDMDMPSGEESVSQGAMQATMHGPDHHGPGNSMVAMMPVSRLNEPGTGLEGTERRVLVYTDLRRLTPEHDHPKPEGEIELHLTGNMERYMWSFDGKKYSEASTPIPLRYGQRFRMTLVNDTMMDHPMHLHGMWMVLENGASAHLPYKHTILVKPGERLSFIVTPDEVGKFAFHCHLFYHMEAGMFRVVAVSGTNGEVQK
jgi:CopA family copper-resistance protein